MHSKAYNGFASAVLTLLLFSMQIRSYAVCRWAWPYLIYDWEMNFSSAVAPFPSLWWIMDIHNYPHRKKWKSSDGHVDATSRMYRTRSKRILNRLTCNTTVSIFSNAQPTKISSTLWYIRTRKRVLLPHAQPALIYTWAWRSRSLVYTYFWHRPCFSCNAFVSLICVFTVALAESSSNSCVIY